jgi:hypothetical protein
LFGLLVDDLLLAATSLIDELCSGLRELCPPLDLARASNLLAHVDPTNLQQLAQELLT